MTSSGSCIVLKNSLGACSHLSTGQASNPTPFARPTRPHLLPYNSSLPVVLSFHISSLLVFFARYNSSTSPNPPPKSMVTQISMIGGEYKVRTITGDEFDVIYTRSSTTLKECGMSHVIWGKRMASSSSPTSTSTSTTSNGVL